jgi:hypothetical protein
MDDVTGFRRFEGSGFPGRENENVVVYVRPMLGLTDDDLKAMMQHAAALAFGRWAARFMGGH